MAPRDVPRQDRGVSMRNKVTDRIIALLGLDLDFSISLGRDPFNAITEALYLGARPSPAQVPLLQEAGVTHVVSCLQEDQRDKVAFLKEGFHPLFIPIRDGMHEDIAAAFPAFFDFMNAARAQQAKVLVHCEAGVSRSATLVIAHVMQRSRKRFFEAYCEVRAKRPEVLPNIGFASQLQRLEFDLNPGAPDSPSVSSLARYLTEVCAAPIELDALQDMLQRHDHDAPKALRAIFADEIPRVIQGVRA